MKQLTRIEAVNRVLKIKTGERISTTGELTTIPQASEANSELDYATNVILTQYKWYFNDIENGQLLSDNDGLIATPDEMSHITLLSSTGATPVEWLRPVNGQIYDIYNHTYDLGTGVTLRYNGKMIWDFDELPFAFQNLAICHARYEIATGSAHTSAQRIAIEERKLQAAMLTANKFDDGLSGGRSQSNFSSGFRKYPPRNNGLV